MSELAAEGTDEPDLSKHEQATTDLEALDEADLDQGSGSVRVDVNLQIMITNLKLLRDELKEFRKELAKVREELGSLKWRNRMIALFGALVIAAGVVAAIVISSAEHSLKSTVDTRGQANAQRQCDNLGAQLVIYDLLLASPGLGHVATVEVGQAITTDRSLRSKYACPAYVYLDPTTNKKISVS